MCWTVKSRAGEEVKLHMTGDMKVVGITKTSLSDIKVGSFVGATTVPGPDGAQNAVEVHVFPEDMRGYRGRIAALRSASQQQHDQCHGGPDRHRQ